MTENRNVQSWTSSQTPSASQLSNHSYLHFNTTKVSPGAFSISDNYRQIQSNINRNMPQIYHPQMLVNLPRIRPNYSPPIHHIIPYNSKTMNQHFISYNNNQAQMMVSTIEKGKASALQTLNSITPVEYMERVRRLSKPILESKKAMEQKAKHKMEKFVENPKKKKKNKRSYFLFSTLVAVWSLFMFSVQDQLTRTIINFVMSELKEGSLLTESWANVPIPINACFYFFDLKNGPQFLKGAKPHLKEMGPFCYDLYRKRRIIKWTENRVQFMERMKMIFVPETSQSIDSRIHMINYPIFVAVLFAKNMLERFHLTFLGPVVYNAITVALKLTGENLVDDTTVRLLMNGKPINILRLFDMFLKPLRSAGVPIPKYFGAGGFELTNHSFGFVSSMNSAETGPVEVYTRTEFGHLAGDIISFEEKGKYPTWDSPCNRMTGGDGMFWKRPIEASRLTLYVQLACRLVPFVQRYNHYFRGARVVRYFLDPQMFNKSLRRNQCFCNRRSIEDCDGWQDIAPCLSWVPAGFSFPHFYQSPNLLSKVDGLKPNKDAHQGYIDMEPLIGVPVNARVGVQGLIDVSPVPFVPSMTALPKVVYPMFWVKVHRGADGFLAVLLFLGSNLVRYGSYAWLFGGFGVSVSQFLLGNKQRTNT